MKSTSLTKKMMILVLIVNTFCAALFLVVAQFIVMKGFVNTERADATDRMHLILRTLHVDLSQLAQAESGYSVWNDTYAFVTNAHGQQWNASYLADNYPSSTFTENRFNVILLVNQKNQVVYQGGFDLHSDRFVPVPKDLIAYIRRRVPELLHFKNGYQSKQGILTIGTHPLLISAAPIVKSNDSGPLAGTMIVGRDFNSTFLSELSYDTELKIQMDTKPNPSAPTDAHFISSRSLSYKQWLVDVGPSRSIANALLYGVNGKPSVLLQVDNNPQIYLTAHQTVIRFAWFALIVSLVLSGLGLWVLDRNVFRRLRAFRHELQTRHAEGNLFLPITVSRNDEIGLIAKEFNNVMESLEASQRTIIHQAMYDHLTGLCNRRCFMDHVTTLLSENNGRSSRRFAVLFIDLDRFKYINDSLGHDIGDEVLKVISQRISTSVGTGDIVSRFGGDEFVVLRPMIRESRDATDVCDRILQAVQEKMNCKGYEFYLTASIGISIYPLSGHDLISLIKSADSAMYEAKRLGKNRWSIHMPSLQDQVYSRFQLENDLRRALNNEEELYLEYQPQVDVQNGTVVGAEALLRWKHATLGMISPMDFIPMAEEAGLIVELGQFVLQLACRQIKDWEIQAKRVVPIGINVSQIELAQPDFVERFMSVLSEHDIAPSLINVEVTETALMKDEEETRKRLVDLRSRGVQIMIDDFGKGYNSLGVLRQLPIDVMKIDQMFVSNIHANISDKSVFSALVSLGHANGLEVLAEGVEFAEQLSVVQQEDCNEYQGYLFSPPIPPERFAEQYL